MSNLLSFCSPQASFFFIVHYHLFSVHKKMILKYRIIPAIGEYWIKLNKTIIPKSPKHFYILSLIPLCKTIQNIFDYKIAKKSTKLKFDNKSEIWQQNQNLASKLTYGTKIEIWQQNWFLTTRMKFGNKIEALLRNWNKTTKSIYGYKIVRNIKC